MGNCVKNVFTPVSGHRPGDLGENPQWMSFPNSVAEPLLVITMAITSVMGTAMNATNSNRCMVNSKSGEILKAEFCLAKENGAMFKTLNCPIWHGLFTLCEKDVQLYGTNNKLNFIHLYV